jgi:hypothetical protein
MINNFGISQWLIAKVSDCFCAAAYYASKTNDIHYETFHEVINKRRIIHLQVLGPPSLLYKNAIGSSAFV